MKKLKLGVVPIKRTFLPMEAAKAQKDEFMPVIRSIKSDYVEIIDVDELTENGIAFTYDVIAPIVKKLKDNEIDALLIGESYQGRGFGKILLENCIAFYKKRGAASVTVALNAENDAALSLNESAGFAAVQDDGIEIEMRLTFD